MAQVFTQETTAVGKAERLAELIRHPVSLRVPPNNYFNVSFLFLFFGGLFFYVNWISSSIAFLTLSIVVLPLAFFFDRIVFDGQKLTRTGVIPRLWSVINGSNFEIALYEVEQVESDALRAIRRGGAVLYRYRTTVIGNDTRIVFASGGERYRKMAKSLLPLLSESLLDNRSIEIRDYINEPKETQMKAEFAKVPSTEVLEESIKDFEFLRKANRERPDFGDPDFEKADYLRTLANELRLSGYLLQALEVFRRALFLNPRDGWLLFEFARCLHSFAGAEKDERLERRALAVLRLAEIRAGNDDVLLSRVGESYFQYGEWARASKVFNRVTAKAESSFRSIRGLAEIALREGKIAHVLHHFAAAKRIAELPSLRKWAKSEGDYFSKLNDDEDYLEMEISRINLLESLESAKRTTRRIVALAVFVLLGSLAIGLELVTNIGWAVSAVSILITAGLTISLNILSERVPVESEIRN